MNDLQAAKGLGVFSVGMGLTQLVAPHWLGRQTGVGDHPLLTRVFGARELAVGLGVLLQRKPVAALWARFIGDIIDIGLLGVALVKNAKRGRVAFALGSALGITLLDLLYARRLKGA